MLTETLFRRRALLIAAAAFALALLLWNLPQLDFLLYPLRLFVTFVHETGHGLAALVSGGQFVRFEIYPNGSGLAITAGGSRALILPAGYLGAAAFGAVLFYLVHRIPNPRTIAAAVGLFVVAVTLLYTGFFSTAFFVGLFMGGGLLALAYKGSRDVTLLVLNMLAILTALNAVLDVITLVNHSGAALTTAQGIMIRNDAQAFSAEVVPLIPGAVWALVWAALAVLMLWAAFYYSVVRPLRQSRV